MMARGTSDSVGVYIKKPGEKNSPVLVKKIHQIQQREDFGTLYTRLPLSVILDPSLTSADKVVYAAVAEFAWKGRTCTESCAVIAGMGGVSKRQVLKSLEALSKRGHIKIEDKKERQVSAIELTSPVFGQKQAGVTQPVVAKPRKEPRKLAACRTCGRLTVKLSKDALCYSCVKTAERERRVREAIAQLGADATPERITAYLKTADATSQVRRTLRSIREVA